MPVWCIVRMKAGKVVDIAAGQGCSVGTQGFAKRLYRFMRRAITRWPEQRPVQPLISLYLAYIAPWSVPVQPILHAAAVHILCIHHHMCIERHQNCIFPTW